jgi:hypothetical protein
LQQKHRKLCQQVASTGSSVHSKGPCIEMYWTGLHWMEYKWNPLWCRGIDKGFSGEPWMNKTKINPQFYHSSSSGSSYNT